MPAPISRLWHRPLLAVAFVVGTTAFTVLAAGHHEASIAAKKNEEKALSFTRSLASLTSEKLRSYELLLDFAGLTSASPGANRMQILENVSRATPGFDGFPSLVRDDGAFVEMVLPSSGGSPQATLRIAAEDRRYGPLTTMLRRARYTDSNRVSDVYFSNVLNEHVVAISTSSFERVTRPEQFVIRVPSRILSDLLTDQEIGGGMFAAITDSSGVVTARSGEAGGTIGRRAPEGYLSARAGMRQGIVRGAAFSEDTKTTYDLVFHRMERPQGWYVTLAVPPGALRARFVLGSETVAWGSLVFLLSLLVCWAAYGKDIRTARMKRTFDEATRNLLRGLPGALLQVAVPQRGEPRMIVSHGTFSPELAGWPPEDIAAVLHGALEAGRPGALPQEVVRGGRTLRIFASGEQSQGRSPSRLLDAYVLDVTELKQAEATAASATRLAAVGKIYASIAHEISQPLNIISLAAENGAEALREHDTGAARVKFSSIVKQARQARQIVDRMLVFARGNPAPDQLVRVDLEGCLAQARALVEPKLKQNAITLKLAITSPRLRVMATPLELEHVLLNVLLNAIHALADNPESERLIEIRLAAQGDAATVEIEDTGGGIDSSVMENLFEPFVTTKPLGAGTGLGLAFVRDAMKSFGGRTEIVNGPHGAVVRLTFRLAANGPA